jgi:ribosomal protein S18 acetylase RimI-like enzyme
MEFTRRQAAATDRDWLWETKCRCLRGYIEQTYGPWDEDIQRARFDASFEPGEFQIISVGGRDAGFTAMQHEAQEVQLFNIMIAPEFQNRGLGTAVLRDVLAGARARRVPVRLQVMRVNPARRLYERLGFVVTEETATHFRMAWRPA